MEAASSENTQKTYEKVRLKLHNGREPPVSERATETHKERKMKMATPKKEPAVRSRSYRKRVPYRTTGESLTKQSFKQDCDINNIMRQFERTGIIDHVNKFAGNYGHMPSEIDYQAACNQMITAQNMFDSLPSKIRQHFHNDPAKFLAAASDPERREEMIELGLKPRLDPDPPAEQSDGEKPRKVPWGKEKSQPEPEPSENGSEPPKSLE